MAHPGHTPCIDVSRPSESTQDFEQILMQNTPRELRLRSWDHKRDLKESGQDPTWAPGSCKQHERLLDSDSEKTLRRNGQDFDWMLGPSLGHHRKCPQLHEVWGVLKEDG